MAYMQGCQDTDQWQIAIVEGGGSDATQTPHKKYPLNYQNYKVCREVSPIYSHAAYTKSHYACSYDFRFQMA